MDLGTLKAKIAVSIILAVLLSGCGAQPKYTKYDNPKFDFSMEYPEGWVSDANSNIIGGSDMSFYPASVTRENSFPIITLDFMGDALPPPPDLNYFVQFAKSITKKENILDEKYFNIGNYNAYELVSRQNLKNSGNSSTPIAVTHVVFVKDGKFAYDLRFMVTDSEYEKMKPTIEHVINSIAIS